MTTHVSPHPDDETLLRLACDEAEGDERAALLEHLETCEECGDVWKAVQQVRREAATFDPGALPAQEPARRTARQPWWIGLAAAATLAAVVIGASWFGRQQPAAPAVRSTVVTAPAVVSPAEAERLAEPTFTWQPVERATTYTVELLDSEAAVLWTGVGLVGVSAEWPTSVDRIPGRYYWRVIAQLDDSTELATPLVSFELTPQ